MKNNYSIANIECIIESKYLNMKNNSLLWLDTTLTLDRFVRISDKTVGAQRKPPLAC